MRGRLCGVCEMMVCSPVSVVRTRYPPAPAARRLPADRAPLRRQSRASQIARRAPDHDSDSAPDSDGKGAVKRRSDGSPRCSCKGMCKLRCPCRQHRTDCDENCQCKPGRCVNRGADETFTVAPAEAAGKESAADVTFVVPDRKTRRSDAAGTAPLFDWACESTSD